MGMYTVDCTKCKQPFLWYSGDMIQECGACQGIDKLTTVESVKKLVMGPGEVLLVKVPKHYPVDTLSKVRETLKKIFDKNVTVVYRDDIEFEVIKETKE